MNHILGHMQVCQNCSARSRCKRADIRQFPSQPCGKYTGRPGLAARRERVAFDANDVFETRLPVLTWARPTPHLSDDSRVDAGGLRVLLVNVYLICGYVGLT